MRIALVNPITRRSEGYHTIGTRIPQLGLQVLARLVPKEHEVDIIDEMFGTAGTESLLTPDRYDMVGMTAYTSGATRAYELAEVCRNRGIRCIMGGPHAWAMPDEAAEHFDSVAVGECDEIWPDIIADAAVGRLKPRYEGRFADLASGCGTAAQGLHPINGRYDVACIQTSRGCPVGCDFCSVTLFNGPKIRRRPIGQIIEEWNNTDRRFIFVVDDNFYGVTPKQAEWTEELLRAMLRHGKRRNWFSQTTINMGDNVDALRLAYKAGCRAMLVGLESFSAESLGQFGKGINRKVVGRYRELVDGFHRAGIAVFGAFVIGADGDTEDTVAETVLQAIRLGIDILQITNLTPLPGTKFYDRLKAEGRLIATDYPSDWERYTFLETVYEPRNVTARRLDETMYGLRKTAAEKPWPLKRALKSFWRTRSLSTTLFVYGMNRGWAHMARGMVARDRQRFDHVRIDPAHAEKYRLAYALWSGKAKAAAPRG